MKTKGRPHAGSVAWFVATAAFVLIAIILSTLLLAALELRWGGDPEMPISDPSTQLDP
jgi:hypothetical protein